MLNFSSFQYFSKEILGFAKKIVPLQLCSTLFCIHSSNLSNLILALLSFNAKFDFNRSDHKKFVISSQILIYLELSLTSSWRQVNPTPWGWCKFASHSIFSSILPRGIYAYTEDFLTFKIYIYRIFCKILCF